MIDRSLRVERAAVHMDCKSVDLGPALHRVRQGAEAHNWTQVENTRRVYRKERECVERWERSSLGSNPDGY